MNSIPDSTQPTPSPKDLYAFEPSAKRVLFLDQRMRIRLAESLRYILNQANGLLDLPQDEFQGFLVQLEQQPAPPLAFSFYHDAILAIEADDLPEATRLLTQLIRLTPHPGGPIIAALADPHQDATARHYARFLDTDPSQKLEIFQPSPPAAVACRKQIEQAFALLDASDPELAAEIRTLVREIILAAGVEDPKAITFDGASAFMLWGAIIINANRRDGELGMAQTLAHESAHNLLFGLSADGPLVENSTEELFPSPLRHDLRPMDGIYHATFVTARMHRAVNYLMQSGQLSGSLLEKARQDLADNSRLFDRGFETVKRHGKLTPLGAAIMQGAHEYMTAAS